MVAEPSTQLLTHTDGFYHTFLRFWFNLFALIQAFSATQHFWMCCYKMFYSVSPPNCWFFFYKCMPGHHFTTGWLNLSLQYHWVFTGVKKLFKFNFSLTYLCHYVPFSLFPQGATLSEVKQQKVESWKKSMDVFGRSNELRSLAVTA